MAFLKELKKLIKEADNQELIVKHVIYYLYSIINQNENIEILLKKNNKFYYEEKLDINNKVDDLIKNNKEYICEIDPGTIYQKITTKKFKKALGQIYTPPEVVEEMIDMYDFEIINKNFQLKIIDISCGSGYFLLPLIDKLVNIGINHLDAVKNCIYGVDKDDFSVFLTKLSIMLKYPELKEGDLNIFQGDILFDELNELKDEKFDLVIGNPPYIGHKSISREYKDKLYEKFKTYKNKSDVSYCFFEKGWNMLKEEGNLIFITSRYFMEGQDSLELRKFLQENFKISRLIDYNGYNLFKNANISPLIIKLIKSKLSGSIQYEYKKDDRFYKIEFSQNNLKKDK
ncbi:MAG: N-6 DNA methylase [Bacillota bacterium]|nr:N-6 DNA methylase [Bacillota bacterium]